MIKSSMTRRIDELGRIVIPIEIRKNLKIRNSDELEINVIDNKIVLNRCERLDKDKTITCLLESIGKMYQRNVLFTSRYQVIDYYIEGKNKISNRNLSNDIIDIIDNRVMVSSDVRDITLLSEKINISYVIYPIVINGDVIGSVIIYSKTNLNENDANLCAFVGKFLENYLE